MADLTRRLFLSFDHHDLVPAWQFRAHAKRLWASVEFLEHPVKAPFDSRAAAAIHRDVRGCIAAASTTLCLIGERTYASRWVDWEVRTSAELGKRVIGVRLRRHEADLVPDALAAHGVDIIDPDPALIAAAMARAAG